MQTPVAGRLFNRAIQENSNSVAELVWLVENAPAHIEAFALGAYNTSSRVAKVEDDFGPYLEADTEKKGLALSGKSDAVSLLNERDIRFRTLGFFDLDSVLSPIPPSPISAIRVQQVAIKLQDGRVLHIWLAPTISLEERPNLIASVFAILALLIGLLGLALSIVITRPIRQLERNAQQVGLAETSLPMKEDGPRELRQLSMAFNQMRSRLALLIHEREKIIVAIAHDISTGLTRLRLRMDEKSELNPKELNDDLVQMERLVSEMLAYSRAESPLIEPELIELGDFVGRIAAAAPGAVSLVKRCDHEFTLAGNAVALRRLFDNLIENARRYGRGFVGVRLSHGTDGLEITIEDDGDGIPTKDLERVFEPFFRGEASRNRRTGGTGLGLGIARAIAHSHGAHITLSNRTGGGLIARVFFPAELAT
ncbi:MAG: ATP-binding protein [Pseudomonadota bacterium]